MLFDTVATRWWVGPLICLLLVVTLAVSAVEVVDARSHRHHHRDAALTPTDPATLSGSEEAMEKFLHAAASGSSLLPVSLSNPHVNFSWSSSGQLVSLVEATSGVNFLAPPNDTDSWWSLHAVTPSTLKGQTILVDLFTPSLNGDSDSAHPTRGARHIVDPRTGDENVTFVYQDLVVDASLNATLSLVITVTLPFNASHVEMAIYCRIGSASATQAIGIEWVSWNVQGINPQAMDDSIEQLPISDMLVWPTGFGMKAVTPIETSPKGLKATYPSSDATYQLIMYYFNTTDADTGLSNSPGLMSGAFDGQSSTKTFIYAPRHDSSGTFDLETHFIPENAGQPLSSTAGTAMFTYPAFIGVFIGDWYSGSRLYKNWAMRSAQWTTGGVLRDRSDLPPWLLNVNTWVNSGWQMHDIFNKTQGDPAVVQQRVSDIVELFNLTSGSLGLHYYEWSQYLFDTHYPDYFPVKPGFQDAVLALQKLGVRVAPYINGRIFDMGTSTWTTDDAQQYACKQTSLGFNETDYSLYEETYGSGSTFAVMCPSQSYWAGKLNTAVQELISYGVDAVYIDQIGAATPKLCDDPTHGHPVGGGNYWSNGYNTALEKIRSSMPGPNFNALLTESNAEAYMHRLNVYLTIVAYLSNPSGYGISMAPVFPSLYGGFYLSMGSVFFTSDLTSTPGSDVFAAKLAWMFSEGTMLGWFSLGTQDPIPSGMYDLFMQPTYAPEIDLLRRLDAMRLQAKEHLTFGRRTRDLVFEYSNPAGETWTHPNDELLIVAPYVQPGEAMEEREEKQHAHSHHHHSSPSRPSSSSSSLTHSLTSALHVTSAATFTFGAIESSAWLSEIGCTTPTISLGLMFINVQSSADTFSISFKIDLRNYDLTDAAGKQWTVWQVALDGSKTSLGVYEGTQVEVESLQIAPREVIYLNIQQNV